MTALWLTLISLLFMALVIVFLPLFIGRKSVVTVTSHQPQQNVAIFKDRLQELEQEKSQGNLSETIFLQLKTELEKSLLADVDGKTEATFAPVAVSAKHWLITAAMGFFVVLASLAMYVDLGRSDDYGNYLTLQAQAKDQEKTAVEARAGLEKLMTALKDKIKQNPRDADKWFLLGNSYAAMGQYQEAGQVYLAAMQNIDKTDPKYAMAKGYYAQALFQEAGEKITPVVLQTMQEALALDPMESSALILAGINAFTTGDIKQAIVFWEKAKVKANENVVTSFLEPVIAQAKAQIGEAMPQQAQQTAVAGQAKLLIKLDIDPALKAKVSPEQIVFVFARPVGGRMPLAAEKLQVKNLPATIVLDDSKSPMPTATLSSAKEVDLTARVSLSGQPQQSKGDLFVTLEKVKVSNDDKVIEMLINKEAD